MAKKTGLCRASNGLYVRNIGWERSPSGYRQHKFYLGRIEAKAMVANLRLEQLWAEVSRRWPYENQFELNPTDRPIWDAVTLAIAEAIRTERPVARVPLPLPFSEMIPESPLIGQWLDRLQRDITVLPIEIQDQSTHHKTEEELRKHGQRLVDMGSRLLRDRASHETLHQALNVYTSWISTKYVGINHDLTPWGGTQTRQIKYLRSCLPDFPLRGLGSQEIDQCFDVLRLRPIRDGKRVSVSWTRNCIKQFCHFLRWLNRSPAFDWRRPVDLEITRIAIPLSADEKLSQNPLTQVRTYRKDELRTLWQYATPFQRLVILFGLNCAFGRAELASLAITDIRLYQKHPYEREVNFPSTENDSWICRVRSKSGVYGEWKLWKETVMAIEWWSAERLRIAPPLSAQAFLVNRNGKRYDTPTKGNHANMQLPNSWSHLGRRIQKDFPSFPRLSLNKLRKTAGNLIRAAAGGECASIFLCHGSALKSDRLMEMYTNRPFGRVFAAIDQVGEELRPIWSDVAVAFPEKPKKGGANISIGTTRRIVSMMQQGYKVSYIAETLAVSKDTVRRWGRSISESSSNKS